MGFFKSVPSLPDLVENRRVTSIALQKDEDGVPYAVLIRFEDSERIHELSGSEIIKEAQLLVPGRACQTVSVWLPDEFGTYRAHYAIVGLREGWRDRDGVTPEEGWVIRNAAPRSQGFEWTANNAWGVAVSAFFIGAMVFVGFGVKDAVGVYSAMTERHKQEWDSHYETPYPNRPRVPATGPVPLRPVAPPPEPQGIALPPL